MTKRPPSPPPKHKTYFIIQKPSCQEEQEIDFFAVKKYFEDKSRLDLENTKTQVRYKLRTHSRIVHPFTIGYPCYLPSVLLAVHSKLHKSEPFHISKETNLCVHKHHGVSLYIGIYHRIDGLCSFDAQEFEVPVSDLKFVGNGQKKEQFYFVYIEEDLSLDICGVMRTPRGTSETFLFLQELRRGYYCPHTINAFSIHVMKQVTSTHPFHLSSSHRLHSSKHLKQWKENKGNFVNYYLSPLKRRLKFSFCSFHWFNFCNVGGLGEKNKEQLCCNANEHIYKALPETLCFSLLLLAILEDVLLAVAQKALSGLLYFLIQNTMTLFGEGLVLQHISQYQYCIIQQLDSFCSVITKPITVNYTAS